MRFEGGGRERALLVRRHPTARALRLAVDPRDGRVTLTVPRRARERAALLWAESKRDWVEDALRALPPPAPIVDGMTLVAADEPLLLKWREDARGVRREGVQLHVGGPRELLAVRTLRWLRAEAARTLEADTRALAGAHGIEVSGVAVGDPRGRWGSCSSSGAIRYSWRLLLAPGFVRRAVVAHEVAHRFEMNHGPRFRARVEKLLEGSEAPARAWLRAHGSALHWFGREG